MFYSITLILRINDYLKAILYRNRLLFDKKMSLCQYSCSQSDCNPKSLQCFSLRYPIYGKHYCKESVILIFSKFIFKILDCRLSYKLS